MGIINIKKILKAVSGKNMRITTNEKCFYKVSGKYVGTIKEYKNIKKKG